MQMQVKCTYDKLIGLDDLVNMQGDLKKIDNEKFDRMKNSILVNGFVFPLFVWENDGTINLLDGNHRLRALLELRREKSIVNPKVPVVFVKAKNKNAAKEIVLLANNEYAKISKKGLFEFLKDLDWKMWMDEMFVVQLERVDNPAKFSEINKEKQLPDYTKSSPDDKMYYLNLTYGVKDKRMFLDLMAQVIEVVQDDARAEEVILDALEIYFKSL